MFTNRHGNLLTKSNKFMKITHDLLWRIGEEPANYSGHSFRKGGAVSSHLTGVHPERIRVLGRWTTDCFLKYIDFVPRDILDLLKHIQNVKTR